MRYHKDFFDFIGFVLAEGDDDAVRALMKAISEQCSRDHSGTSTAFVHPKPMAESGNEVYRERQS